MSALIKALLLVSLAATCTAIVGGEPTQPGAYPYMAAIFRAGKKRSNNDHVCAATVIHNRAIITTADCCGSGTAASFFVRAGTQNLTFGGSLFRVAKVIVHPKSKPGSLQHNYCILRTTPDFSTDPNVMPALLPDFPTEAYNHLPVKALGWGRTDPADEGSVSSALRQASLSVVPAPVCADKWRFHAVISDSTMCTAPSSNNTPLSRSRRSKASVSACYGDVGGPVVNDDASTLIGIIAYHDPSCSAAEKPNIQSDVYDVKEWIDSTLS